MTTKPMKRFPMRQPGDWLAAWRAQAAREGLTLAEWIGERCNDALPQRVRRGLSERVRRGKPRTSPDAASNDTEGEK